MEITIKMERNRREPVRILEELAEETARRGDYEGAARLFRHISVHFGVSGDRFNQRRFAVKAGEYYVQSAERLGDCVKAIALYLKAIESFTECGENEKANLCGLKMWERFTSIRDSEIEINSENINIFRAAGDYFVDNGDFKKANIIYLNAAERALKSGRLILAGRLYRSAGDCDLKSGRLEEAAALYIKAAGLYFSCQEYFEAAWSYCEAGFLLICLGRFKEASSVSDMAEESCNRDRVEFFLKDLIHICKLLSRGLVKEARDKWDKVKIKVRREYAQLIESSFQSAEIRQ
ncbi:MAG: hypothetical protein N3E47_03565 [Candidatus Bathyarchaeota archaeon]|nr:hypothetical protein [Candidatus Bathyarchaeota archaeon]